jgi:hypothetical protein
MIGKRYVYLIYVALIASSLTLAGCFDEFGGAYDGPLQLEFAQVGGAYSTAVANGAGPVALQVNLIGPQQDQDLTVSYAIDQENTTAVEGENYSVPDGGSFTIPAGQSFGQAAIQVLQDDDLAPGTAVNIVMELQGSSSGPEVIPAENLKTFTIQVVQPE